MRGKHGNHVRGAAHWRWRGGNPAPDPEKRRANAKASAARHPERRRARENVKDAVRRGDLPVVSSLTCTDCTEPARYRPGEVRITDLAGEYGVSKSQIWNIVTGREWNEFPGGGGA